MTLGSRTALSGRGSRQFTQASTAVALKPKIETPRVILTEYSFMVSKCLKVSPVWERESKLTVRGITPTR